MYVMADGLTEVRALISSGLNIREAARASVFVFHFLL